MNPSDKRPFGRTEPAIPCFMAGTRTVGQLEQNLTWFAHDIPGDFWRALKKQGLLREDAPVPG